MALWPFRRKSVRKRSRSGATLSDNDAAPLGTQADAGLLRIQSKKARTEPAKLQRRQPRYSFSPGRHDSIRIEGTRGKTEKEKRESRGHGSAVAPANAADRHRTPTLHPTRRKSSKRRREDHDREAEIKAMSAFMPARSVMESHVCSGTKQGTKRAKTGGVEHECKHVSQISLSYPDSVRSAMSVDSDFVAYKLSAFDALAPRPTLKCAPSTRRALCCQGAQGSVDYSKRPLGDREPIHEHPSDARKRVDDLADGLDAKDLRELMERDNRRRERRRLQDQERLERRLARGAERSRREQEEAMTSGSPPSENLERGVMGREMVGLGIGPASTVVTSSKKREPDPVPGRLVESDHEMGRAQPLEMFHRPETAPKNDDATPIETKPTRPWGASRTEVGHTGSGLLESSSRLVGMLHSKMSHSKSTLASDKDRIMDEEYGRKDSESSGKTPNRLSLTSLLKWGGKGKRPHSGPSSFSNASREEVPAAPTLQNSAQAEALAKLQGDDIANQAHHSPHKSASSVPKRTKSRFREDLPEFPLSPPDSRVQSPEAADPPLVVVAEGSPHAAFRLTPSPGHDSSLCGEEAKAVATNGTHLSMSLASIDSEGSWLSGRVGSLRQARKRSSVARISRLDAGSPTNSTREDLAIADDDCLSPLTADRNSGFMTGDRASGDDGPSSDGEESFANDKLKWGRVGAKPDVVEHDHHDRATMRSFQGLLNIDSEDEEDGHGSSARPA